MRRRTDALFYTLLFGISCSEFKRPLTKPNQDLINWNQFVSVNINAFCELFKTAGWSTNYPGDRYSILFSCKLFI